MSISPLVIALRTIGVDPSDTLLVTGRPFACSARRMMLPSRLPSVSIFEETTIGSASAGAATTAASASPTRRDLSGSMGLSFDSLGKAWGAPGSFPPVPEGGQSARPAVTTGASSIMILIDFVN